MFYKDVGHSQEGAKEVTKLLDAGAFDGPKPVRLLTRLLTLANLKDDSIVLDFFSGSATTAHAVMQMKSACAAEGAPSKAVFAVSRDRKNALSSWRISLSHLTTGAELKEFLQIFDRCYRELVP